MNHSEAFKYFENKFGELTHKYGFNHLEVNPCHIESKEDLYLFTQRMVSTLFDGAEFSFIDDNEGNSKGGEVINFLFNGEKISLTIDPKFGHIEVDFFKTIKLLATLSRKFVTHVHPSGVLVSGNLEDMKAAWHEGFPIRLDEIDFLHKNVNGKRFKKDEIRSSFILDEVIDINYYQKIILKGLNVYLSENKKNIRYCDKQIRVYNNYNQSICSSLNGKYSRGFKINDGTTIFENGFVNHIFLLNHWSINSGVTLKYVSGNGNETGISIPFKEFISNFGKEN